jgi:hypothetical protein
MDDALNWVGGDAQVRVNNTRRSGRPPTLGVGDDNAAAPPSPTPNLWKGHDMTPDRLAECLRLVRWQKDTLAEAIDVPSEAVTAWMAGTEDVPRKVAAWIEALCFVHEAAEESKPSTAGEGFGTGPNREFIPVYSYNLLRSLNAAPMLLRSLFGSDDEGAVFFLVSRGLATRDADTLRITDAGRAVGSMSL